MQNFDQALMDLLTQEVISYEEAIRLSTVPEDFAIRYQGITPMDEKKWEGRAKHGKKLADEWEHITEVQVEREEVSEDTVTAVTKTKTRY